MHFVRNLFTSILLAIFHQCNASTSTKRIIERLDAVENVVDDLRNDEIHYLKDEMRKLRMDLKRETDFRREDIENIFETISGFDTKNLNNERQGGQADVKHAKHAVIELDKKHMMNLMEQLFRAFKSEKFRSEKLRQEVIDLRNQLEKEIKERLSSINRMSEQVSQADATCQDLVRDATSRMIQHTNATVELLAVQVAQNMSQLKDVSKPETQPYSAKGQKTCDQMSVSGKYTIYSDYKPSGLNVYCEVDDDNTGWTVIQRRQDGSVDFNRTWLEYREGFGDLEGEFWLGNEHLYQLTKDKPLQLRIDIKKADGTKGYELYSEFQIASETERYSMSVQGYKGDAIALFDTTNKKTFQTYDKATADEKFCCSCIGGGGWWPSILCWKDTNLNSLFRKPSGIKVFSGGRFTMLQHIEMKIQ